MTAFPTLKNNYYIRRLAPFLIVYLVYELIEVAILAFLQQTGTDWNSLTLLRLLGNLLVETCSSFLYLIIPTFSIWRRSQKHSMAAKRITCSPRLFLRSSAC